MMKEISNKYTGKTFENIKYIDDNGNEYWLARELQKVLEYKDWRNFKVVIDKAIISCKNSEFNVVDYFVESNKMIELTKTVFLKKKLGLLNSTSQSKLVKRKK